MSEIKSKKELMGKLRAMGKLSPEQKASIVCSLVGHSRIQRFFFGYFNCARCDAQLGDNLAGVYDGNSVVIVGHDCEICRANYEECTWRDKYLAPDPFKTEAD